MQVICTDCDWTGDSDAAETGDFTENKYGVETQTGVCPDCGGELVEA